MRAHRLPQLLLLSGLLSGCAHWGTSNLTDREPSLPAAFASSTYLAPVRPALPPEVVITATAQPPPPGSTVLAISKAHCDSGFPSEDEACLRSLVDETRRLGGNGLFGVHTESAPRAGTSLVGTAAFDPSASPAPMADRRMVVDWQRGAAERAIDVYLERQDPRAEFAFWQLVCKLPCTADLDATSSYRLKAPSLYDEPPLPLAPPVDARLLVTTRVGKPDYSRVWLGLGTTLVAGAISGGTLAYYVANQKSAAGTAELTVGLSVLPYVLYGILEMLEGPVNRVELVAAPEP